MSNNLKTGSGLSHEKIETNNFLMIVLILLVLLAGGMVEIVPLFFSKINHRSHSWLKAIHRFTSGGSRYLCA
jgi:cbb3-type cytochrome oxidase cytochrome c subunit